MPPLKREERAPDQAFDADERLYRRFPPECLSPWGEVVASKIGCSFEDDIESCPSTVRGKYGTPADVLHADCAGGNDVSTQLVAYLISGELPANVKTGQENVVSDKDEYFDFYPFHDPEVNCYAHSVIASRKRTSPPETYDRPTSGVRNKLKAAFVSAFRSRRIDVQREEPDAQ
jgi:hypothetical protein